MATDIKDKNPWKTKSTKVIYDNPWITLHHDEVTNPGGKDGIYGRVSFKNIAVGVVPMDAEGNIYLVGQYRYAIDQYSWEIPEGGCPITEDPLEAGKRELKEETGLHAKDWTFLRETYTSNAVCDERAIIFLAEKLTQGIANPEDSEELIVKKVPFLEALKMVENGMVKDSISIIGILSTQTLKNKRGL